LEPKVRSTEEKKELILRAYQERASLRAVRRRFGVSIRTFVAGMGVGVKWKNRQPAGELAPVVPRTRKVEKQQLGEVENYITCGDVCNKGCNEPPCDGWCKMTCYLEKGHVELHRCKHGHLWA
jgi:hypothetical protein